MKTIHNSGVDVLADGTLTRVALLNTALTFSVFIRGEWGWGGDREEHLSTFDPIHHTIQERTQNDRRRQVVFLDATRVVCMSASARMRVLFMWKKEKTTAIFDGLSVYDEQSSVLYACTLSTHTHTDTIQSNRVFGGLFLSIKHTHTYTHTPPLCEWAKNFPSTCLFNSLTNSVHVEFSAPSAASVSALFLSVVFSGVWFY